MSSGQVILIAGDDPTLIAETLSTHVESAVGDQDRSLVLEEIDENNYRSEQSSGFSIAPLIDAAQTPTCRQCQTPNGVHVPNRRSGWRPCRPLFRCIGRVPDVQVPDVPALKSQKLIKEAKLFVKTERKSCSAAPRASCVRQGRALRLGSSRGCSGSRTRAPLRLRGRWILK